MTLLMGRVQRGQLSRPADEWKSTFKGMLSLSVRAGLQSVTACPSRHHITKLPAGSYLGTWLHLALLNLEYFSKCVSSIVHRSWDSVSSAIRQYCTLTPQTNWGLKKRQFHWENPAVIVTLQKSVHCAVTLFWSLFLILCFCGLVVVGVCGVEPHTNGMAGSALADSWSLERIY